MRVKKDILLKTLEALQPGISDRDIKDQYKHFGFTKDDAISYNDMICVVAPFKSEIEFSVPAKEFYNIIKRLPNDDIDIQLADGKLSFKSGKTKASMKTQEGKDIFAGLENTGFYDIKKMSPLPSNFFAGLKLCVPSASKDQTNKKLTGLYIDKDVVMATDFLRASRYIFKEDIDGTFLMDATHIQELLKYSEMDSFYKNDNWVFFENKDGVTFCSRLISLPPDQKFPAVDDILDFKGIEIELPESLKESVEMALVMANGDTPAETLIEVVISNGKISCKGENDNGWVINELSADIKLDREIKFEINPGFLMDIMNLTRKMVYIEGRAKFETKDFSHALCIRG